MPNEHLKTSQEEGIVAPDKKPLRQRLAERAFQIFAGIYTLGDHPPRKPFPEDPEGGESLPKNPDRVA